MMNSEVRPTSVLLLVVIFLPSTALSIRGILSMKHFTEIVEECNHDLKKVAKLKKVSHEKVRQTLTVGPYQNICR